MLIAFPLMFEPMKLALLRSRTLAGRKNSRFGEETESLKSAFPGKTFEPSK